MPDKVLKIFKFDMSKGVCSFKKCHYRAVEKKYYTECFSKSESQVLHPLNYFSGVYNEKKQLFYLLSIL